jgi:peptidoglycan/xylan/chitin deacetylase (PgdA/CDA1 family)
VNGFRNQVARVMRRTGVLDGVLRVRSALRLPVLTVLTYHHVDDPKSDSPFDPGVADATPQQFRRQMELVAKYGTPVTIDQVWKIVCQGHRPPRNPVLVTFDDGYRSCLEVAAPILQQVGLPATFFISTRFIDERRLFWWERVSVLLSRLRSRGPRAIELSFPRVAFHSADPAALDILTSLIKDTKGLDIERFLNELAVVFDVEWTSADERRFADELIMTWDQVRALANAGMDIESHTRSHRVLQTVPVADLKGELDGARRDLEHQLRRPVRAIAYPVGRPVAADPTLRSAVREAGYELGFSNASGTRMLLPGPLRALREIDPFDLGRLAMGRECSDSMFLGQLALPQLAHRARHSAR